MMSALSCTRPATQLVVVVDADLDAAQIRCVRAVAGPSEPFVPTSFDTVFHVGDAAISSPPFSFGVTPPGGNRRARVDLRVGAYADCAVAEAEAARGDALLEGALVRRKVRTGFVDDQSILLRVFLASRCASLATPCTAEQTCDPESGMCVAIPDIDPSTLAVARPGDEFADAGVLRRDAGPAAVDTGPRPDAGPSTCDEITDTAEGSARTGIGAIGVAARGTHVGWGYQNGANAGGVRDGSSSNANQSGSVNASTVLGTALSDDGNLGILYASLAGGVRLRWAASGSSTTAMPGGMYGTRPLVADGDTFNVLRGGGTGLSVLRVTTGEVTTGPFMLSTSATTKATLGQMRNGIALSYATSAGCFLATFDVMGVSTGAQSITDCVNSDITELDNGRFAVAWVARDQRVFTATLPVGLATLDDTQEVGAASVITIQISAITGGRARIAWVDALPSIRTVLMPGFLNERCLVHTGTTPAEYARFRTASRATETLIAWPAEPSVIDGRVND